MTRSLCDADDDDVTAAIQRRGGATTQIFFSNNVLKDRVKLIPENTLPQILVIWGTTYANI